MTKLQQKINGNLYKVGRHGKVYILRGDEWILTLTVTLEDLKKEQHRRQKISQKAKAKYSEDKRREQQNMLKRIGLKRAPANGGSTVQAWPGRVGS